MVQPQIARPTLLIRPEIVRRNIARMVAKAKRNGHLFRPHFKTHQSWEIGRWFRKAGIDRITVSSIEMAEYFAADGWNDILIAFPVNVCEMDRLNQLAKGIQLHLILDHEDALKALQLGMDHPANVWVEVDCGDGRTGIPATNQEDILQLSRSIIETPQLNFGGLITHAGHAYSELRTGNPNQWFNDLVAPLQALRAQFKDQFPDRELCISYGDTPSCSMLNELPGVDEIRPGNFVFFDLMQEYIGSCQVNDVAVAMAVPVVSVRENSAVVHGGGVHFAKDRLEEGLFPLAHAHHFGWVVEATEEGWRPLPQHYLKDLSQEHGEVNYPVHENWPSPQIGDTMLILPVHSCMTADLMMGYRIWSNGTLGDNIPAMKAHFARKED